ncbi:hypothetical protein OJF2_75410 [Aquisphaera giovannonii]|uniref:Uncharacterized protein n=1 Tax=Aquisphaera giovannonii TaxID=406548 RepID=A0A5B9W5X5_9BACT|nr:hypothetical protein [Aquisphaera giovannonii]QEH31944.1 hypothetical protein OJF2_04110 [Aquisphaera giovannonii]QEH32564.1 hypothetical protein OJF2_10410 [Aquisphaera giovannonii]QEH32597.1 hypothetical protein OJF2_10760 [Aquisphaera giovannonii]QEH33238.1 hypothetical protein OJF2_17380 [Aquisphaera giovannonii]QEH34038.1 hypothetical protein OJF2_25710 [Aquisphaera giovannonii]
MSFEHLPERQARLAQDLYEELRAASDADIRAMAELLATKPDDELFGEAEFQLRDMVHRVGAKALQAAAMQRKKGGM